MRFLAAPGVHLHLAELHLKEGRRPEAIGAYRRYLLLRPGDFDAHIARATLLGPEPSAEGEAAWEEILRRFPRRADALIGAARFHFVRAARAPDAEAREAAKERTRLLLAEAVSVDPENVVASELVAQLARLP